MYSAHLEEGNQHVHSVPEEQNGTSDEEAVLYLKYFCSFLKKKQNSTELVGAIAQYFGNFR